MVTSDLPFADSIRYRGKIRILMKLFDIPNVKMPRNITRLSFNKIMKSILIDSIWTSKQNIEINYVEQK